mmetsp:Transcript_88247/g.248424  ORF Transcript_88247/g.248424 Transcript_88247/m.248424 type:complete len:286 (+) Transcript_88247:1612-2469(+)
MRRLAEYFFKASFWHDRFEELCLVIFSRCIRVQHDFEKLPVPMLEEGVREERHGMVEEIRGNIPDFDPPLGRPSHEPVGEGGPELVAKSFTPSLVRFINHGGLNVAEVIKRQQSILRWILGRWRKLHATLVHSQGLRHVAMVPKEPTEVVVGLRIRRGYGDRTREVLQRLHEPPRAGVCDAEVVQCLREAWVTLERRVVTFQGLLDVVLLLVDDTHVVVGLCAPRVEVNCKVVIHQSFRVLSELCVRHAQVVVGAGACRTVHEGFLVAFDRALWVLGLDLQAQTN